MIADKKKFMMGCGLMATFAVILILIFMPLFNGHNGLDYLDDLYNSISKGSAYYIPKMKEAASTVSSSQIDVSLDLTGTSKPDDVGALFTKAGAQVREDSGKLTVAGNLQAILDNCLADSDLMYHNDGAALTGKYGYDERQVVYNWYLALKSMEKQLKGQKKFSEAKIVAEVVKKAVECSYNFYEIEPKKISGSLGVVLFSLVFYVVYTLWYGFGFMYLFEGWGMKLEDH